MHHVYENATGCHTATLSQRCSNNLTVALVHALTKNSSWCSQITKYK